MPKTKKSRGSKRASAGLPAKAGRRKLPTKPGPHVTKPEDRAYGRFLSRMGLKGYKGVAAPRG